MQKSLMAWLICKCKVVASKLLGRVVLVSEAFNSRLLSLNLRGLALAGIPVDLLWLSFQDTCTPGVFEFLECSASTVTRLVSQFIPEHTPGIQR